MIHHHGMAAAVRGTWLAAGLMAASSPARAETWEVGFTWGNDLFTELDPPIDDSGFTNDLRLRAQRHDGERSFGATILHRMITERGGPRRWDQLDVLATGERRFPHVTGAVRLGPSFGGNLGGRALQNAWHSATGSGPTLSQGLQHRYAFPRQATILAGARVEAALGSPSEQFYAVVDGQVPVLPSAGVGFLDLAAGGRVTQETSKVDLSGAVELALTRYASDDPGLTLPGAHRPGAWHVEWRISLAAAWSRYRVMYQYRGGEGGSGEPIGVLDVGVRW
jgi:hypothetical protein